MSGTRWKLTVKQPRTTEVSVADVKAAVGFDGYVAVGGTVTDVGIEFTFSSEREAKTARYRAQMVALNALCAVEEYLLPARLSVTHREYLPLR